MSSPEKPKKVMSLADRVAALSHFVSPVTDRCTPFFNVLKGSKKFKFTEKYEQAFLALQRTLRMPTALIKANIKGKSQSYLNVSEEAVSPALVREEEKVQWPVYYMSKRLLDAETRYAELEKLALTLVVASKN